VFDGNKTHINIFHHAHNGMDRLNFSLKITLKDGVAKEVVPAEFKAKGPFRNVEYCKLPSDCLLVWSR
jgi:hypothetical protein